MVDNTTELLSLIVKAMSKKGIEVTKVKIYEQAVEINKEVEVCMYGDFYFVYEVNKDGRFKYRYNENMTRKVVELLTENDWLPGDDIEAYGEWFTLVMQESKYYIAGSGEEYISKYYRLLDKDYYLSDIMELKDLKMNYTNVSLERGRLK